MVGGFSLTILLLSTFEKARCCFFQHQERRNLIQSLTLGQQIGGGRWSGGPMSAVSTPVQAATPPCLSPAKPFPLLLSSPHPTPPLSITSTGTPSPHERLCSRQVWRSNTVLAVPFRDDNILQPLVSCFCLVATSLIRCWLSSFLRIASLH